MSIQLPIQRDKMIETARQLISIPTVNPPGTHYSDLVSVIVPQLKALGLEVQMLETDTAFPKVVCWLNKGATPELHFNGHYDVVPAGENWTVPPFQGVVRGNRIYGRGAADMKGGIASVIAALEAIIQAKIPLRGSISLSLVPDEETGGFNGTSKLVQTGIIHPDMVVIPEPSFPRVLLGHKGVIQLLVRVIGMASHAAMPTFGDNAFERMVKLVSAIIEHWNIENGIVESCRHPYPSEADVRSLPTLTLGGICSSGNAVNSVPDQCTFSIDRRFTSVEDYSYILQTLEDFIAGYDVHTEVERLLVADSSVMNQSEGRALLYPLQKAITSVFGKSADEAISAGFMDTRFFRKQWNIPCVGYGPGDSGVGHTPDEYISIDQMVQVSQIFALLMQEVIGA